MTEAQEGNANADRRRFIKGAATGVIGAMALNPLLAEAARPNQAAASVVPATDEKSEAMILAAEPLVLQKPAGLKPGAVPDSRFPMFYEYSVPAGMNLVVQHFKAMSQRDLEGMASTLHYPFVTYERNEPVVVDSLDNLMANPPASMDVNRTGADSKRGLIHFRPGSYDLLDNIQMHVANPLGAGFSLQATRYRADGLKLAVVHMLFGATNNNGKWGIEFLSTIMLPADQTTETYDAEECINSLHHDWRIHGLCRFDGNTASKVCRDSSMFVGPTADVWIGGDPTHEGDTMAPYKIKGVTSRLRQRNTTQAQYDEEPTPEELARGAQQGAHWIAVAGSGAMPWYESMEFPDTKILFGSNTKCHMYSGFRRYMADGTIISENRFITAAVFRDGVWHTSDIHGMFGQITYRDHLNDVQPEGV